MFLCCVCKEQFVSEVSSAVSHLMRFLIFPIAHSPNPSSNSENVFLRAQAVSYFSFETVNGEQGASGEALENGEERAHLRRSFNN